MLCQAITKHGTACRFKAKQQGFCGFHIGKKSSIDDLCFQVKQMGLDTPNTFYSSKPSQPVSLPMWMCPVCNSSYLYQNIQECVSCFGSEGERKVWLYLKQVGIPVCPKYQIDTCTYDFYFSLEGQNFLLEYDGPRHIFPDLDIFGTKQYPFDAMKNKLAPQKGYHLLRIGYDDYWCIDIVIHRFLFGVLRR